MMLHKLSLYIYRRYWQLLSLVLGFSSTCKAAGDNPFPSVDVGSGDIVTSTGTKLQTTVKFGLIGIGSLLILVGIGVLISRIRDDSRDKEHGNTILTIIILALVFTVGFLLIAIGWKASSANIS